MSSWPDALVRFAEQHRNDYHILVPSIGQRYLHCPRNRSAYRTHTETQCPYAAGIAGDYRAVPINEILRPGPSLRTLWSTS